MKDYSNYNSSPINKLLWSANKVFNNQLKFEGQDVTIQNEIHKVIVRNHGNPTNEFKEERYLITGKDIKIQRGYIINYLDEDYIIITDIDKDNQVYNTCKLLKTTHILSWLNSSGDICSSPVFMENYTKYSDGVYTNPKIKLGDTMLEVTFPSNENTNEFKVGKRFIVDEDHIYKISDVEVTSPKGLKKVVFVQSQFNKEVDNLDLLIADYYGNTHNYRIEIVDKTPLLMIGEKFKLQINTYDRDIKIDNPKLIMEISNEDVISIEDNNITALKEGKSTITVKFKDLIEIINVRVTKEEVNDYTCEIEGKDYLLLNRTKEYIGKFYNKGIEIEDTNATWFITDECGNNTNYAKIIKIENNKCTIKTTEDFIFNDNSEKYIYLHLKGTTGESVTKKIKLVSY